jgi:glycosyltransferase involved in cell wall biosynthesis
VHPLYERIVKSLDLLDMDWELIVVDDGSTDDTPRVLSDLHQQDNRVRAIILSRNFGQGPALTAGIEAARGDAVIILDADGQDPPEIVPEMVAKWRDGFEVVGGHRIQRAGHPAGKRAAAFLFYRIMNAMVGWDLPPDTGEFRLIDRAVVDVFLRCPQRHRLVRTLTSWSGFRQTTVDYEHGHRHSGASKYTWRSSARLAITSITSFSLMPLRLAGLLGIVVSLLAGAATLVLLLRLLLDYGGTWLNVAVAGLWLLGGIQCILIGILGEYVGRTYLETQHRPIYVVRDTIGLDS